MTLDDHGWCLNTIDEAGVSWVKVRNLQWSSSFMDEAGVWWVKLEDVDEAGGGLYSVMSRRRFRRVYRQAMYSRQCAWSYGSGGVSKARGMYTCGCTKTPIASFVFLATIWQWIVPFNVNRISKRELWKNTPCPVEFFSITRDLFVNKPVKGNPLYYSLSAAFVRFTP